MTIPQAIQSILAEALKAANIHKLPVYTEEDGDAINQRETVTIEAEEATPIHENIPGLVTQDFETNVRLEPSASNFSRREAAWSIIRNKLAHPDLQTAIEAKTGAKLKHFTLTRIYVSVEDDHYAYTVSHRAVHFIHTN